MKNSKKILSCLVLAMLAVTHCQNVTDAAQTAEENTPISTNTLTFKMNGNPVTLSEIAYTKSAGESFIGKQANGSYINIGSAADFASGDYDKNSNPVFVLQYVDSGVVYDSSNGTANVAFSVTVGGTEITGTFSGTLRRNDGAVFNVTEGRFKVNK